MFSEEEIEALALGSRWVAERADGPLSKAARNALAKVVAVLPDDMRDGAETTGLLVGPGVQIGAGDAELATIRQAIRAQRKLAIAYVNQDGAQTRRTVWPFALAFFAGLVRTTRRLSRFAHRSHRRTQALRQSTIPAGARRCSKNGGRSRAFRRNRALRNPRT